MTTYWDKDNHLKSAHFDDVYFSRDGGLAESRYVFLKGAGLPNSFKGHNHFRVLELGFGTGLNIWALIELWLLHAPKTSWLHINSIEAYPLDRETARKALEPFDELRPIMDEVWPIWPEVRSGHQIIRFPQWRVTLSLYMKTVEAALDEINELHHAIFLDGFSPALNPQMWSEAVMLKIADLSAEGACLATFTAAGSVKRALIKAGFEVSKTEGFGRKRERLLGQMPPRTSSFKTQKQNLKSVTKIAIIGAGIAGLCSARFLLDYGFEVDIFDKVGLGGGASGNPYALVNPRLDAGGGPKADLAINAHYFAKDFYQIISPESVIIKGVVSFKDIQDKRLEALLSQSSLPIGALGKVSDDSLGQGLVMRDSFVIEPLTLLKVLAAGGHFINESITSINQVEDQIGLRLGDKNLVFDKVILACGSDIFSLLDTLGLGPVAGQIEYQSFENGTGLTAEARTFGHYGIVSDQGLLIGASHERGEFGLEPSQKARLQNLDAIKENWPETFALITDKALSRRSVRVMARDYQPVHGWLSPNLGIITGLGSRGFSMAPYLAHSLIERMINPEMPIKSPIERFWGLTRKGVSFSLRSS